MQAFFVAGHRSEEIWSELVVCPLSQGMAPEIKGDDFGWVVLLTVRGGNSPQAAGQNLVAKIDESFGGVENPLTAQELLDWWQAIEMTAEKQMSISVAQILGDGRIILVTNGGHRLVAFREGRAGYLVKTDRGKWRAVAGEYRPADKWFWGTEELFEAISPPQVAAEMSKGEGAEIQASLMSGLQLSKKEGAAGAVISFGKATETEAEGPAEIIQEKPAVYLKTQSFKRRRFLALGILLIGLILGAVWIGGKRRVTLTQKAAFDQVVTMADGKIQQAKELAAGGKKQEAVAGLKEMEARLNQVKSELAKNKKLTEKLTEKMTEVNQIYVQISGEEAAQVNEAWYDLSLIKEGLYGIKMDQTAEQMEILDGTAGMVVTLGFDKKGAGLTGSGELLKGGTLIAAAGKRTAVYVPNKGVMEINTSEKTTGNLISPDGNWQRLTGLALFSGNVYLVDAGASDIYMYPGMASGVGEKKRWLKPGQESDLTKTVDLAVDGDLWTLDDTGKIRRFRQGEQIDFGITGLENPLGKSAALVIPEDSDYVYVLDQGKRRVVVTDKKGEYQKQYQWDGLAGVTDIAVDEAGGSILALSGDQIYRIQIEVQMPAAD